MPSFTPLLPSSLSILLLLVAAAVVDGGPDLTFVSGLCGPLHNTSMYHRALGVTNKVLRDVRPGDTPTCGSVEIDPFMYASAWCSAAISEQDCRSCSIKARSHLLNIYCRDLYGAQLVLKDCSVRYETYKFC